MRGQDGPPLRFRGKLCRGGQPQADAPLPGVLGRLRSTRGLFVLPPVQCLLDGRPASWHL